MQKRKKHGYAECLKYMQMTKNKLVCALAWRENEGEANKNYFVSLGSAAWLVQKLYYFFLSFLSHTSGGAIDDVLCKQSDQGRAATWLCSGLVWLFLLRLFIELICHAE